MTGKLIIPAKKMLAVPILIRQLLLHVSVIMDMNLWMSFVLVKQFSMFDEWSVTCIFIANIG